MKWDERIRGIHRNPLRTPVVPSRRSSQHVGLPHAAPPGPGICCEAGHWHHWRCAKLRVSGSHALATWWKKKQWEIIGKQWEIICNMGKNSLLEYFWDTIWEKMVQDGKLLVLNFWNKGFKMFRDFQGITRKRELPRTQTPFNAKFKGRSLPRKCPLDNSSDTKCIKERLHCFWWFARLLPLAACRSFDDNMCWMCRACHRS